MKTIVFLTTAVCVAAGAFGQEIVAASAVPTDLVGVWRVVGERPTAEGRMAPLDTTARISPSGNGIAVYVDGKTLTGEYRGSQLSARQETSIAATGRSGKGRTHVGQVWDLSLAATAPDRLEGWYSVTHSGFQASEAGKNGSRTARVVFTRLGDDLVEWEPASGVPQDPATATAHRGRTGSDYAYVAWEYAESSGSDVDVLIRCDALGLDKVVRRGERGLVKAGAGEYRLLVRDPHPGERPNWSDKLVTLYVEPSKDLLVIISTNAAASDRAGEIRVLMDGEEVVRQYLMVN